ncbi:DUF2523 domain-containing protein [Gilvimarinus algae]|uniref:DUF2523 domain-containing protein n=1 Tax=Gilvimarinus algae TaxID=3058037 RepID=A0ABT8TIE2_9GAMM|nr:DUF2523 domain-containing protein [Gilvimarinus sp. SDUM040014]MDO3383853.1 DUF2523 domain-containing protein [Gilvimarinus sp. SDUM040014]
MQMPSIFSPIAVFLATITGPLVARVMLALGVGVISYTGIDVALTELFDRINTSWSGIPANVIAICGLAGIDVFITLVASAYMSSITFRLVSGAIKRIGFMNVETEA